VRGLFDGDGCVYLDKDGRACCGIDGNYDILYWVNEKFREFYKKVRLNRWIKKLIRSQDNQWR
jgi:hypothetical protein